MKWISKLFKRSPKRTLPLDHVYTFEDGTKLYTYKAEHYGKISSRHYRNIQEAVNYLMTFYMTKNEWLEAVSKIEDNLTFAIQEAKTAKRIEPMANSLNILKDFKARAAGLKNANQTLMEYLFCTFYLIDDETETGYSELHNSRKIDLLNSDPLMADFFLTNLQENMRSYFPISEENTLIVLGNLIAERERIYSSFQENLKKQTSPYVSSQEPTQSN
jgi:hypothetical protein